MPGALGSASAGRGPQTPPFGLVSPLRRVEAEERDPGRGGGAQPINVAPCEVSPRRSPHERC